MNYHKIKHIDKDVCTCEQVIAYKLAIRLNDVYGDNFRKLDYEIARCEAIDSMLDIALQWYINSYTYSSKYDTDAVICALRAGLYTYLTSPFIAVNYTAIGSTFPALYLK